MDPVSHFLLGAAVAIPLAPRRHRGFVAALGGLAAVTPDLDVLLRSSTDPLMALEYHRHFSHALPVAPVLAAAVAGLTRLLIGERISFSRLWCVASLGIISAILLDLCTSYGTSILWPLSDQRFALSVVSVIDPVVTFGLLAGVAFSLGRSQPQGAVWTVAALVIYLGFGAVQQQRAEFIAQVVASDRGHRAERLVVKPYLGSLLIWRTVYLHNGRYYVDAIRTGVFADIRLYIGGALPATSPEALALPPTTRQGSDVRRFAELSNHYLVRHPFEPDVVGDVRYSVVPNGAIPLWGVRFDPVNPNQPVRYETFRAFNDQELAAVLDMLFNRAVGGHEFPKEKSPASGHGAPERSGRRTGNS